jgi:cyanate permease
MTWLKLWNEIVVVAQQFLPRIGTRIPPPAAADKAGWNGACPFQSWPRALLVLQWIMLCQDIHQRRQAKGHTPERIRGREQPSNRSGYKIVFFMGQACCAWLFAFSFQAQAGCANTEETPRLLLKALSWGALKRLIS